jgi:hypothetical protein
MKSIVFYEILNLVLKKIEYLILYLGQGILYKR